MPSLDLSIVIASYNTRGLLRNCINSIYDSTKRVSFEILVVDACPIHGREPRSGGGRAETDQPRRIDSALRPGFYRPAPDGLSDPESPTDLAEQSLHPRVLQHTPGV